MRRSTRELRTLGITVSVLLVLPAVASPYAVIVLSSAVALAIACLGVNLLLGYTGLVSLGHAAFFGVGGYAGAFLFTFGNLTGFEAYVLAGVAAAAGLAAVLGTVCVRATRGYFGILTLAFAQMLHALVISGAAFRPFGEHGKGYFLIGGGGLYLPRLTMAGQELEPPAFSIALYYAAVALLALCAGVLWLVVHSPFGLALRGIRDSEVRAAFVAVPVRDHRWRAFVLSAAVTGAGGALASQVARQVTPPQLDWLLSAQLVVATVLGGSRHFLGPVAGAFALTGLQELALRFALYHRLILGVVLVAVVLVLPDGIAGGVRRLVASVASRWTRRSLKRATLPDFLRYSMPLARCNSRT